MVEPVNVTKKVVEGAIMIEANTPEEDIYVSLNISAKPAAVPIFKVVAVAAFINRPLMKVLDGTVQLSAVCMVIEDGAQPICLYFPFE